MYKNNAKCNIEYFILELVNKDFVDYQKETEILIKYIDDINKIDENGDTLLHCILCKDEDSICVDFIKLLVDNGANLLITDRERKRGSYYIRYNNRFFGFRYNVELYDYLIKKEEEQEHEQGKQEREQVFLRTCFKRARVEADLDEENDNLSV